MEDHASASSPAAGATPSSADRGLPGSLLAVAVILFVLGVLAALGAAFALLAIALAGTMPAESGLPADRGAATILSAFVVAIGIALAIAAAAHLVVGLGIIGRRVWARVAGLVLGVLGIVLTFVTMAWSFFPADADPFLGLPAYQPTAVDLAVSGVITAASVLAYLFVLVVLWRRGTEFR
jgi:hypothetical protein